MNKTDILDALATFANQRPGLNFADYGDATLYRQDYNQNCARPLQDFRAMLSAVRWRDSLNTNALLLAIEQTNRLSLLDNGEFEYTPGQMGATEYRHAACIALSRALWNYWRGDALDAGRKPREYITRNARAEFGRGIADRYFD